MVGTIRVSRGCLRFSELDDSSVTQSVGQLECPVFEPLDGSRQFDERLMIDQLLLTGLFIDAAVRGAWRDSEHLVRLDDGSVQDVQVRSIDSDSHALDSIDIQHRGTVPSMGVRS